MPQAASKEEAASVSKPLGFLQVVDGDARSKQVLPKAFQNREWRAVRAFLQVPRWRLPSKDQVTIRVLYKGCNRVPLKSYSKATI